MYHEVAVVQQHPLGLRQTLLSQATTTLLPKTIFQLRGEALDMQAGVARGDHEHLGDAHRLPHPKQHYVGGVFLRQHIGDQPGSFKRLY